MNINTNFSRNLIKGKITEVIFEQMIREEERYTIIPFGYEHTTPTLAQYRHIPQVKKVIENISDAPDFALISEDKTKLFLVEVKYQKKLIIDEIITTCKKLLARWESPWIFVSTPSKFYCSPCSSVAKYNRISPLSSNWVIAKRQVDYIKLLNEFIRKT